jgi:hypothetical protein
VRITSFIEDKSPKKKDYSVIEARLIARADLKLLCLGASGERRPLDQAAVVPQLMFQLIGTVGTRSQRLIKQIVHDR